jgi:Uma2 family endonuclease
VATQGKLLTAEDLLCMPEDDFRYELLDGVLVQMSPPGAWHGAVGGNAHGALWDYLRQHPVGRVFDEVGVILRRNPDRVRAPDVCFVSAERLPPGGIPRGYFEVVPDLVVEVLSPTDRRAEVEAKIQEWLQGGARIVWLLDPDRRTVAVYAGDQAPRILTEAEALTAEPLLPGFRVPVRELFA